MGFLCAPEVAIGIDIPLPELALFKHAMPIHAFHDTVLSARRWSGPEALANGIVSEVWSAAEPWPKAMEMAVRLSALGDSHGNKRRILERLKGKTKGHIADGLLAHCFPPDWKPSAVPLPPGLDRARQQARHPQPKL